MPGCADPEECEAGPSPRIGGPRWAWAVGPDGERLQAEGDSPHDALMGLPVQLRGLSK